MSDELLLRRLRIGWHDDDTPIWVSDAMTEAADRIEQLTAERDHAWEMAANADTQMGQSLADHLQAKAERDRLRAALGAFVAHYPKGINPDLDAACFDARAALKGETP